MTHQERTNRRRRIADLLHNGLTLGEVAGQFGVSMTMARMSHDEFYPHEPKPKKGKPRASATVRILALLIQTPLTLQEIADRTNVSYQRCQQIRDEMLSVGIGRIS